MENQPEITLEKIKVICEIVLGYNVSFSLMENNVIIKEKNGNEITWDELKEKIIRELREKKLKRILKEDK